VYWGFSEKVVNKCSCDEKHTSGDGGGINDEDCISNVTHSLVSVRKSRSSRLPDPATLYVTCNLSLEGNKLLQSRFAL
jgi:hypothetical protein